MDYNTALEMIKSGRGECNTVKKLCPNTILRLLPSGEIELVFYNTCLITYAPDYFMLNTDGYHTSTTLRRINEYAPKGKVRMHKKKLYYQLGDARYPFNDGMVVSTMHGTLGTPVGDTKRLGKIINNYVSLVLALDKLPDFPLKENTEPYLNNEPFVYEIERWIHGEKITAWLIITALKYCGHALPEIKMHFDKDLRHNITVALKKYLKRRLHDNR